MKKNLLLSLLCFIFSNLTNAQQSVSINGPSEVEVGIPYNYTFNFNPVYPNNSSGVANSYIITEWIVVTGLNGTSSNVTGYINTVNNIGSYYYDGTYNNVNPKTVPIQWGSGTDLTNDNITVKVSGIYRNSNTGANIGYFNFLQNVKPVTIRRLTAPIITGNFAIPCGSQAIQTYSISNSTNATSILWTVGSGATIIGSNTGNSITVLPPLSTIFFNVDCKVSRGGSNYSKNGSKNVERTTFSQPASITGADRFCPPTISQVYTISNIGVGNTFIWSSSNTAVATISNATSSQVTVNKVGFGTFRLNATITNPCGQQSGTSKLISILDPVDLNTTILSNDPYINSEYCDTKWHYVEIVFPDQAGVTKEFLNVTANYGTLSSSIAGGIVYKLSKGFSGQFDYGIIYSNGCGIFEYYPENHTPLMIRTCRQLPQGGSFKVSTEKSFEIFPNPSQDIINIRLKNEIEFSKSNIKIEAQLFDKMGQLYQNVEIINNSAIFNVKDFPKGIYFLKIENNGEVENHQIAIQ